jgi:DNA-binding transcriptional LysR family regulator
LLLGQGSFFHHQNLTLISGGTTNIKGELRVAGSASFGHCYMAPYINEFRCAYPDLHVRLALSDGIFDIVEQGFSTGTDAVVRFIVDRLVHHAASQALDKDVALPVHCALADLGGFEGL